MSVLFLAMLFIVRINNCLSNQWPNLDINLANLSIDEILRQITLRHVSCQEITRYFLHRIDRYNPILKAVITVDEHGSLRRAEQLDDHYRKNKNRLKGRLHCIPALIKDNIFVKGLPTTLGIRLFSNATANEDASAVEKLKEEGAVILGKANMIMFAAGMMDLASETGGLARNPYAYNYTVVGSSTGNAVALSARLAVIGLGSDSGGSITAPSSATHVVGLRPATGSVDMQGVFPLLGQPFDTIGPMALNAKDVITLMDILQTTNTQSIRTDRSMIRIGILHTLTYGTVNISTPSLDPSGYFTTSTYSVDPEVQACFKKFQTRLEALSKKHNIFYTIINEDMVELARPILENENDRWSCIVTDMNKFLKQYPMRSTTGELMDNIDRITKHPSTPAYYRALFQFLNKRTTTCNASRRRYARHLSSVRAHLRRRIFHQHVDMIAMPTLNALPWPIMDHRSAFDDPPYPHSNGHLYDLGGLFALPTLNLPLCFSKTRPGAAPQGLPVGGYFMTIPEKLRTMLEFAQIYEEEYQESLMPLMFTE